MIAVQWETYGPAATYHDLDPVTVAPVEMLVVPAPGRLQGGLELDFLIDVLDPDVGVGVALYEQRADQGGRFDLNDLGLQPGQQIEAFRADR